MFGESKGSDFLLTDDILKEIIEVYSRLDPDLKSLESGIPEFKIKRAIQSLKVVMERRGLNIGVDCGSTRSESGID